MAGEIQTTAVITDLLPSLHADSVAHLTWWSQSDVIQWMDEACKKLTRAAQLFVERDTSIETAAGTPTYSLPSRHFATLHTSLGNSSLRPAAAIELEARDPGWQTTPGTPDHWYEDKLGTSTIGLAPVPTAAAVVPVICAMFPPDLDVAQLNTLLQAPAPLAGYLFYSVLAGAYGREGESEMPDLAAHARARVAMYEQICQQYWGKGSDDSGVQA